MQDTAIQVFQYNGSNVTFNQGDSVMVNATEMAKPFGKEAKHFLGNKQTKELILSISAKVGIPTFEIVKVIQGSPFSGGGTWMHCDLALIFAQWLSPDFYLWCNDRIKELLTKGATSIVPQTYLEALKALVKAEEEKELLRNRLSIDQPKADYCDVILRSKDSLTVSQIAKDYGMSAKKFNAMLAEFGVQYKIRGQWLLTQKYAAQGYHDSKTTAFVHSDGSEGSNVLTVWTQKGRLFLYNFLKPRGILPLMEQ